MRRRRIKRLTKKARRYGLRRARKISVRASKKSDATRMQKIGWVVVLLAAFGPVVIRLLADKPAPVV